MKYRVEKQWYIRLRPPSRSPHHRLQLEKKGRDWGRDWGRNVGRRQRLNPDWDCSNQDKGATESRLGTYILGSDTFPLAVNRKDSVTWSS